MKHLDELKKLNLPRDKFAVFGSGPLAIRGLRDNDDIDIIVKTDIFEDLAEKYPFKNDKKNSIKIGNIEIFKDWLPWFNDPNHLVDCADKIKGIRFVKLEYVMQWKKAMNREKDRKDIRLIEDYLKSHPEDE